MKNSMKCPTCSTELKMSERSGIEIDYCPQCRGVWLDKGELDKIIERSGFQSGSRQNRIDDNDDDDDDYNRHDNENPDRRRGKRSFLGDLFDF